MAKSIDFNDSIVCPQIQLADLCAGITNHLYKNKRNKTEDELSSKVPQALDWTVYPIGPEVKFNSEDLGVGYNDDYDIVEKITEHLINYK